MLDPNPTSTKITPNPQNPKDGYVVGPLVGSVGKKQVFTWEAPDDSAITIMFPPCRDPLGIGSATIEPGKLLTRDLSRAAAPDLQGKTFYRYAIFCHKTNNFATMNSDPEIIIVE